MIKRLRLLMAVVAGIVCVFGTSTNAVELEDVYVTGGIAHWPEFGPIPSRFSFDFPAIALQRSSPPASTSQTSVKFGVGLSINETWAIEAVAILGMEHESTIESLFDGYYERIPIIGNDDFVDDIVIDFDLGISNKLKASILRINPVYTIPLQHNRLSLFGKAGIAFIERDWKVTIRTDYEFDDDFGHGLGIFFPSPVQTLSESDSTTNVFASAGLRWNPTGGQSAISVSFSNYFDTPGDVKQSLELDYQWQF